MLSKSKIFLLIFTLTLGSVAAASKKPAVDRVEHKWHASVAVLETYFDQPARQIETNLNNVYNLSAFTGLNTSVYLGGEYTFSPGWRLMAGLVYRQVDTTGSANEVSDNLIETFKLAQRFYGAQVGLRYVLEKRKRWSLIGIAEYDRGTSISLTVTSGPAINPVDLPLPTYFSFSGGAMYAYPINDLYFVDLGVKAGAVITTNPINAFVEAAVGLRRDF
jgi:hypothetical protein